MPTAPLKTFIIYARADEGYKRQLLMHLRPLVVGKLLTVWHDGDILPGENWQKTIKKELETSELVIVLVSVESLNSEFIQTEELRTALDRLAAGLTRVVPVVVSPCVWKFDPILKKLQALPSASSDGVRPVSEWSNHHLAWANVVERIGDMVEDISQKREAQETSARLKQEADALAEAERQQRLEEEMAETKERLRQATEDHIARENAEREQRETVAREAERLRLQQEINRQKKQAHDLVWQDTCATHTVTAYEVFTTTHPDSEHIREAHMRIRELRRMTKPVVPRMRYAVIGSVTLILILAIWWVICPKGDKSDSRVGPLSLSLGDRFVRIPGGTFAMGCTNEQRDCDDDEKPTRQVTISTFWMANTELTFEDYDAFCDATKRVKPNDKGWGRGKRPAINVSWNDAVAYCNWRSAQENRTPCYNISGSITTCNWHANGYRLPTEAEWEYAARGGGKAVLFGNGKNTIDPKEVNFDAGASYQKPYSVVGESRGKTVPVGSLNSPNPLGLHDMSGNVYEWCWDWNDTYPSTSSTDPKGPDEGLTRVLRGGSWSAGPRYCCISNRSTYKPWTQSFGIGIRLCLSSQ